MVNIICALKHEARPLIEYYRLVHDGSHGVYATYRNADISLTVTGSGRPAAATGTRYAGSHARNTQDDSWLNLGIAGHRDLPVGTPVLAGSISDGGANRVRLPGLRLRTRLATLPLTTLDQPAMDYRDDGMFDMEAAGFYHSARQFAAADRIYCLKVISDNTSHPVEHISKQFVLDLITGNMPVIQELIRQLHTLPAGMATT